MSVRTSVAFAVFLGLLTWVEWRLVVGTGPGHGSRDGSSSHQERPLATGEEPDPSPARPRTEEIEAALGALDSPGLAARQRGVEVLLRGDHSYTEITHLALRATRWERDVGLLADLLSDHPDGALPHVLHRVTHAATIQRGQICRALGRRRADTTAAIALLLVRGLRDFDGGVRSEARLALGSLSAGAVHVLEAHYRMFPRRGDGSVAFVSASILLGAGNLRVDTPYRRALDMAFAAEAARFGGEPARPGAPYQADPPGTLPSWDAPEAEPLEWREEDLRLAKHLAADYGHHPGVLGKLLDRPRYMRPVVLAYGLIGPPAREEAPHVVAAWRRYLLGHLDPTGAGDERRPRVEDEDQRRLVGWDETDGHGRPVRWDEVRIRGPSAAIAFALVRLGNRSDELMGGLWELLALPLHWYDRELVEVTLQALRPSGPVVHKMLRAVRPPASLEWSAAAVSSARVVLPWCDDGERSMVWRTISDLIDGREWSRAERMALRHILREHERLEPVPNLHAKRLIQRLRQYASSH